LECYEVEYVDDTFGTNLSDFANPVNEEFSLSCQKTIWRSLEAGVEYRVAEDQGNLQRFSGFFHSNFVDRERFEMKSILEYIASAGNQTVIVEARYKGQTIGMSLNYSKENALHAYLSASLPAFDFLSPAYVMRFGLTLWGKENGFSLIHDGGLLMHQGIADVTSFKQQFAKHTSFKFCTGRKIWNEEAYLKLCAAAGIGTGADAFPAYRAKEAGEITDTFI
jgi:serine/alanine adding enzyme